MLQATAQLQMLIQPHVQAVENVTWGAGGHWITCEGTSRHTADCMWQIPSTSRIACDVVGTATSFYEIPGSYIRLENSSFLENSPRFSSDCTYSDITRHRSGEHYSSLYTCTCSSQSIRHVALRDTTNWRDTSKYVYCHTGKTFYIANNDRSN